MDAQLEERLKRDLSAATHDVEAPVGFAHEALRSGRRLRRRRTSALVAAGVAAVVAGALLVPTAGSGGGDENGVDAARSGSAEQLEWAESLPEGPAPALPFYSDAGLRDGDTVVEVPDGVDTSRVPQRVSRGWLVMLRTRAPEVAPAVLFADGSLDPLPPYPDRQDAGWSPAFVSVDGTQVAYGNRVVDIAHNLDTTEIPHDPAMVEPADPKYFTSLRISGWSDVGLVYEGAPTFEGIGTEWLLRPDGSTVELGAPGDAQAPSWDGRVFSFGRGVAGYALTYDYSEKNNTCAVLSKVTPDGWVGAGTRCLGRYLGESLDLSPDGHWLLTDELPEIWDVENGEWVSFDVPKGVLADEDFEWLGAAGWESNDALLIPLSTGKQTVQVVRCTVSTASCQKAGAEVRLTPEPGADPMFEPGPSISFADF